MSQLKGMKDLYSVYARVLDPNTPLTYEDVCEVIDEYVHIWGNGEGTGSLFIKCVGKGSIEAGLNLINKIWRMKK